MLFLIIFLLLIIILIVLLVVSYKFFNVACSRDDHSIFDMLKKKNMDFSSIIIRPNVEWLKEQDIQDVYIKSRDGLKLHGVFLPAKNAYRTIICVHAYRGSYATDFSAIIKYLNANHSNVLLIEQRCHGESEGKYITFGAKEKYDVVEWVNYTISKLDDKNPIYLYGLSMGCTTSLLALGCNINSRVKGVIADCGYTSMKDSMESIIKNWYGLPTFPLINFLDMYCNLIGHFSMSETDTKKALKNNEIPILFIHGEDDDFVSGENARQNYARTNGPKEIVWVAGAKHAESIIKNPDLYHDKLEYFFNTYK